MGVFWQSAYTETMNTPHDSTLGRETPWPTTYDPSLLFPIARAPARSELALGAALPFTGVDVWNAYELSWLGPDGKPRIALARFDVPAESPNLIESKSFKLYLGSFAAATMPDAAALQACLERDLAVVAAAPVTVVLTTPGEFATLRIETLSGECIDNTPVTITDYGPPQAAYLRADAACPVSETLVSRLFKSNCPVTGQPDWASVQVAYAGPRIDRAGLLRYLISFREHTGFHEQCVEQIFCDLQARCQPSTLTVYARYTRRGGLDINPWRSTHAATPPNPRLARQ